MSNSLESDTALLVRVLYKHGENHWLTAKRIHQIVSYECGAKWDRRYIAMLADAAKGRVIGTTKGYRLQDHASDSEIMGCYRQLADKADGIAKRAKCVMTYYHRGRLGAKPPDEAPTAFNLDPRPAPVDKEKEQNPELF